ncbi:gamma-glutamylcyclotransferase family protein [Actinoplanes sp. M2I2]|uniref:gamma-glutamylcyclotransferase family protein n=1 Tax=Actinoplanes sp. M2I2 TaxID=1734444 RepID=UPI0020204A9A|nr:gamma-glutamylcyclotransferase family protein [Actinoplanes sp. M2I2]
MAAVFAYGSLVAPSTIAALGRDRGRARLTGWSRSWNVCTDNTADGPVVYEQADGTRPPIQVLFLTIEPGDRDAGPATVEGVLIELPDEGLPALDAREGNYRRIVVDVDGFGRAWTYVARPHSAERARRGIAAGTARIRRDYLDTVVAAFGRYEGMPAPGQLPAPVVDLRRVVRPRRP